MLADRYQNQKEFSERINKWFVGFPFELDVFKNLTTHIYLFIFNLSNA